MHFDPGVAPFFNHLICIFAMLHVRSSIIISTAEMLIYPSYFKTFKNQTKTKTKTKLNTENLQHWPERFSSKEPSAFLQIASPRNHRPAICALKVQVDTEWRHRRDSASYLLHRNFRRLLSSVITLAADSYKRCYAISCSCSSNDKSAGRVCFIAILDKVSLVFTTVYVTTL